MCASSDENRHFRLNFIKLNSKYALQRVNYARPLVFLLTYATMRLSEANTLGQEESWGY